LKLEDEMLRSVGAARSGRRDDYERRARAAGVPTLRTEDRDVVGYAILEESVRRGVRKLALDRSLRRISEPAKTSILKRISEWNPAIKMFTAFLALATAAVTLYLKFIR
jgi:hypothetical protein